MKKYLSYELLNTMAAFVWIGRIANILKWGTMFAVFQHCQMNMLSDLFALEIGVWGKSV